MCNEHYLIELDEFVSTFELNLVNVAFSACQLFKYRKSYFM